ncbi:MAG TPA: hypothetical protein HA257_03190 [Candidatus Methanoperedenaceae archaeon]|nr:hypothetical protein [Candidatus Methanoperedenaceae archaeon]
MNIIHHSGSGNPRGLIQPWVVPLPAGKQDISGGTMHYPTTGSIFPGSRLLEHSGALYHQDKQKISREVEEVKKLAVETRRSVEEQMRTLRSQEAEELKKIFNMDRLSDEVYRTIERRIRTERESRGA